MELENLPCAEDFLFLSVKRLKVERIPIAEDRWNILISVGKPERIFTIAQVEAFLKLIDGGEMNLGLLFAVG